MGHFWIFGYVVSLTASFVVRLMMAINHKLKASNSVGIPPKTNLVQLTRKIIDHNTFVCFHFSGKPSEEGMTEQSRTFTLLYGPKALGYFMIACHRS